MNNFRYSNTNKRYHTLDYHFKQKFGQKVGRIPIDAGFTCPNIDGSKGFGGCTFCNINGSGDFAGKRKDDLLKQWNDGKRMMEKKWKNAKFIAYFQAFTNTYAPLDVLIEKYEVFANLEECVGISIATRADCLDEETIKYLAELSKRKFVMIEIGLQTIHEKTSEIINRGHTLLEFENTINLLAKYVLNTVVHIINGLPNENMEMMLETAKYVGKLNIQGIKIHLLHVMSDTPLVNQLNNGFLKLMQQDDYVKLVVEQLEYINPEIVIHRLTGDAPSEIFIGPIWSKKKTIVLNEIDKLMVKTNTYQGAKYEDGK